MQQPGSGWWAVAWSDQLDSGAIDAARIGGLDLVVYRGRSGRVYAVDAARPDRGLPMIESEVHGESLESLIDGTLWAPGHVPTVEESGRWLRHYAVVEQAGLVLVGVSAQGARPDLTTNLPRWIPANGHQVWEVTGSPLITLENLCDPCSLGYVLGASVINGPSVISTDPGDFHLDYQVFAESALHKVSVCALGAGLMHVREKGRGGVLFAATPVGESRVAVRASIGESTGEVASGMDWAGCIDRHVALTAARRHGAGLNLSESERLASDVARKNWSRTLIATTPDSANLTSDRASSLYGWLPVSPSSQLASGAVIPIRIHGREVVLWRGESGQVHALNAHCAHLGHHLGYGGQVRGEDVRCFYHGWCWSPEGTNTHIPYDRRIHRGRRLGPWSVAEAGGLIYLWHPGSNDNPDPTRPPPVLPNVTQPRFNVRSDLAIDPRLVIQQFVDPITLGQFAGAPAATSAVMPTVDAALTIRHTLVDRQQVTVTVYDAATVRIHTDRWTLLTGVCPTDKVTAQVMSTLAETSPPGCDHAGSPRNHIEDALDRQLGLAARMIYLENPHGTGAEIVAAHRSWARSPSTPSSR